MRARYHSTYEVPRRARQFLHPLARPPSRERTSSRCAASSLASSSCAASALRISPRRASSSRSSTACLERRAGNAALPELFTEVHTPGALARHRVSHSAERVCPAEVERLPTTARKTLPRNARLSKTPSNAREPPKPPRCPLLRTPSGAPPSRRAPRRAPARSRPSPPAHGGPAQSRLGAAKPCGGR